MKTIFAKYNSERLPKYQIITKIILDENRNKFALKEALCEEAKEHIERIYKNYELLKSAYNINLVKPTKIENGLSFEMANGKSLEKILLEAISQNDNITFEKYIDKFLEFVDGMVYKRNSIFEPAKDFEDVFGKWEVDELQDIIKVANVDLIFSNIFVDENDDFTLIDYEWVFEFEVPKNYVIWRSFYPFYVHYIKSNTSNIFRDYVIEFFNLEKYIDLEKNFYNYAFGNDRKYFLASKVPKTVNFINLNKKEEILTHDYFIQLFIENENSISEENSLKLPVSQNYEIQTFEFDLKDFQNIKNLRLDPFNDSCVIEIEKMYVVLSDGREKDLIPYISANVCSHHGKSYFFEFFDPQIHFKNIDLSVFSIVKFVVEVKYSHIARNAVHACIKQIEEDKKFGMTILEQTIQNQNQKLKEKEQIIQNQNQELEIKEQILQEKYLDIEIIKEKLKLHYIDIKNEIFKGKEL